MPSKEGVYIVQYIAKMNGAYMSLTTDLIFLKGIPHAVYSWSGPQDNQSPAEMQKLDPALLEPLQSGRVEYLYHGLIEDHRKLH
jgi:hypothetical protein